MKQHNCMNGCRGMRAGFTIVELLVVIAIIGVLMTLTLAGIMRMISVGHTKTTETLLTKCGQTLLQQWSAMIDTARNEDAIPSDAQATLQAINADPQAVRDNWTQVRLVQQFPRTFAEAVNPTANGVKIAPDPVFLRYLAKKDGSGNPIFSGGNYVPVDIPATTAIGNTYESSICLYLALSISRRGMVFDTGNFTEKEVIDVGGLKAIVDAWGEPVKFSYDLTVTPPRPIITSAGADRRMGTVNDNIVSDQIQLGN